MFETGKESFAQREKEILEFWKKEKIFEKSLEQSREKPPYTFFDGPPFATGLPHYGHLLAGFIKDATVRYYAMKGFSIERRFGWDCHGLPIENIVEKKLGLTGGYDIERFGIDRFNEECRSVVLQYTAEWKRVVERTARWIDIDGAYKTMDPSFMESVWWVFKQIFDKGLVYQGCKVMPVSTKLGTVLSNFEAGLNYLDVKDPWLVVAFKAKDSSYGSFLAWTTTPWTLPSNLALVVHPEIDYVTVETEEGQMYTLAKSRLSTYFDLEKIKVISHFKGSDLKDLGYEPLYPFFADHPNAFRVIVDTFVTTEDGTGIVHAAPGHGEADFYACKKEGIESVCPVDMHGLYTEEVPLWKGIYVKDADLPILQELKERGKLFKKGSLTHRYPFCWRSDTPLIYKTVTTWFVAVEKIKEALVEANRKIHWVPEHLQEGRFGKWLEGARDWAISRNRYWGTPIPIWMAEDGHFLVIGSLEELYQYSGKRVEDLHRHYVDSITFTHEGRVYQRIPEVFDCWFESGSMPYAKNHYPFEKEKRVPVPADFIAEGIDQTRGWFYTLHILSVALFNLPAFKNVIVNGIVLAEDGAKMSKKLQNYPDPELVIDRHSADSVRLYLLASPAAYAEDLSFSEKGVELVTRQMFIPLWNSYLFLATYAKIYHFHPQEQSLDHLELLDRWMLSRLYSLMASIEGSMEKYHLADILPLLSSFIDDLTNWYIRRSRSRFWSDKNPKDQQAAFSTLYLVLKTFSKLLAPFAPFMAEALYRQLRLENEHESVHLCDLPKVDASYLDPVLEKQMALVMQVVNLGHSLRKTNELKVRQPLPVLHIIFDDEELYADIKPHLALIADELNVKKIDLASSMSTFVQSSLKPNFRVLGKKYQTKMPLLTEAIHKMGEKEKESFLKEGSLDISIEGETYHLTQEDLQVKKEALPGLVALTQSPVSIILETSLTHDLMVEGLFRELVSRINVMRKEALLEITDRIQIFIDKTNLLEEVETLYLDRIKEETVALTFELKDKVDEGVLVDLNGEKVSILIKKST